MGGRGIGAKQALWSDLEDGGWGLTGSHKGDWGGQMGSMGRIGVVSWSLKGNQGDQAGSVERIGGDQGTRVVCAEMGGQAGSVRVLVGSGRV